MARFKRVSADEAHAKAKELRREFVRDHGGGSAIVKAAKAPTSWNQDRRSARFVMTTQQVDRYGDIVVTAGIDTTEFMNNPVGLLFHNSRTWPVATWQNMEVLPRTRPPRLEGDFVMLPEGGPVKEVDECAWMIANGGIRACSIGFDPDWDEIELILDDEEEWITGFQFNKSELLECSVCSIPANAGALAKSAHGDTNLAKELLEDVLDNWVKTPAGILLSREDYESAHKGLSLERSFSFVSKDLSREEPAVIPRDDRKLAATTEEEAKEFVGAKVVIDPAHPENKDWPFDVLAKATGEVIASYIVDHGEFNGVHGLAVEFLTDDFSGMFRGIKAERFLLAAPAAESEKDVDADVGDDLMSKAKEFAEQIVAGDEIEFNRAKCTIVRNGAPIARFDFPFDSDFDQRIEVVKMLSSACDEAPETVPDDKISIALNVDTSALAGATKDVEALNDLVEKTEKRVEGLFERIRKFFGTSEIKEKIEPTLDLPAEPTIERSPPTEDEIAAARTRADEIRQRLAAKGMIAA